MSVGFQGVDRLMARLEQKKALIYGQITDTKKRIVRHVLTDLVKGSPQWSGNLASQWYVEFHGQRGSYHQIANYSAETWYANQHYQMGDDPAVTRTLNRELPKIDGIRWNSKVRIVNYAPYAAEVEQGIGPEGQPIRDENLELGRVAMVAYVANKYNNIRTLKRLAE